MFNSGTLGSGRFGKSLVTPEFNQMCTDAGVEARVQAFPNPGDPMRAMRLINFKSYYNGNIIVIQFGKNKKQHVIPPKGQLEVMLTPEEELPLVRKGISDGLSV